MRLAPKEPCVRVIRHAHLFCGVGGGAKGFNRAKPRVGNTTARFVCVGGIDVDPGAIANFTRIAGVPGTVMDLFDREQYMSWHGREPANDWEEATPDDIRRVFGPEVDVAFLSAPCKGFSGLLSATQSKTDRYQALNRLTLRGVWLMLEAYKDNPIPVVLFENVPRILTRGKWLLDQIQALFRAYGYSTNIDTHDCGVIGNLAQSRKRALLIARHMEKVPPFVYQPRHYPLRGVGEVIGKLPLPGDPIAGAMHRVPALQWKTWVRLALVPAGKDWRALNDLAVVDGNLRDFGIVPEVSLRENALGVNAWTDTAPVITSHRAPGQGRFSVADPRPLETWHNESMGVRGWTDPSRVVAGASRPQNGAHSVADPRHFGRERSSTYGVKDWTAPAGTVAGESFPTNGAFSVADPRPADGANATYQQYGVKDWSEAASTVSGQSAPGGGAHSIADPRLGRKAHSNVYRVVPFDRPAIAVTSSRDGAVADPRPAAQEYASTKYQVTPYDRSSRTVIGASTTGDGAFAVADPRPNWGNQRHQNILRVTPYEEATGTISGGGHSVTGGQPCVADARREHYQTGGHYGVVPWERAANAVSGSACHDNGFNSVADPREAVISGEPVLLPKPEDRLVCRIIATDGTWHRPFTTLDLGALQALFDPEEIFYQEQTEFGLEWRCRTPFDLEQGSDVTKREWIGNMVPGDAATGMAETIGEALILADMGESFFLSTREIWVKPGALALSIDNDQPAFAMDGGAAA
jgi:site-specific DNA-cytosine methylase